MLWTLSPQTVENPRGISQGRVSSLSLSPCSSEHTAGHLTPQKLTTKKHVCLLDTEMSKSLCRLNL